MDVSYGIQIGKMAGLCDETIDKAEKIKSMFDSQILATN